LPRHTPPRHTHTQAGWAVHVEVRLLYPQSVPWGCWRQMYRSPSGLIWRVTSTVASAVQCSCGAHTLQYNGCAVVRCCCSLYLHTAAQLLCCSVCTVKHGHCIPAPSLLPISLPLRCDGSMRSLPASPAAIQSILQW
jgi:hypothetical protein